MHMTRGRHVVLTALSLSCAALGPALAADKVALDNPYVRVTENAAPCAATTTPGCGDRVIVAMGTMDVLVGTVRRAMTRGEIAVFKKGESYPPPVGQFFEVAIKPDHPPVKGPPETIMAAKNVIVYDSDQFFIYEERLAVGDTRERHGHAQRVEIRINQGPRLVQIIDGRDTPLEPPTIVNFRKPIIHVTTNVGDMPLWNFILEFKPPR
jgi:hypothetical protein